MLACVRHMEASGPPSQAAYHFRACEGFFSQETATEHCDKAINDLAVAQKETLLAQLMAQPACSRLET